MKFAIRCICCCCALDGCSSEVASNWTDVGLSDGRERAGDPGGDSVSAHASAGRSGSVSGLLTRDSEGAAHVVHREARLRTSEAAEKHLFSEILPEIKTHASLLKPGWRVQSTPEGRPAGCTREGRHCIWSFQLRDVHEQGPSLSWAYFSVDADSGRVSVVIRDQLVPLKEWRSEFATSPY